MKGICSECGDRKILNASGVCKNRHGCEHRQFQHRARTERLLAEMDRQAWHNDARSYHQAVLRHPSQRNWGWVEEDYPDEGYDGSSLLNLWKHGTPERTNLWIDEWLHRPEDDEE